MIQMGIIVRISKMVMPSDHMSLAELLSQMSGSSSWEVAMIAIRIYGDRYSGVANQSLSLLRIGFILD